MELDTKGILIVEDEPTIRALCATIVTRHGLVPVLAANGEEGLDIFRERHQELALVLSDVSMPVMDGVEMVRRIFHIKRHSNVILMSGLDLSQLVPSDLEKLCSTIKKPFTPKELIAAIEKCLDYDDSRARAQKMG